MIVIDFRCLFYYTEVSNGIPDNSVIIIHTAKFMIFEGIQVVVVILPTFTNKAHTRTFSK